MLARLIAGAVFVVAALGMVLRQPWWLRLALPTAALSLAICLLGWPGARVGAVVDVAIFALVPGRPWVGTLVAGRRRALAG